MKLYKTREKILGPLGNDRYETIYQKDEIVMLIDNSGPFPLVKRVGSKEKPRSISWSKLEEHK